MTDLEKQIVKKNENWIKEAKLQAANYKNYLEHEEQNIRDLTLQNRIMKGRY